jgi:hypothetical protein
MSVERPQLAHSFRGDHRNVRPFAEELRPLHAKGDIGAGRARRRLFR